MLTSEYKCGFYRREVNKLYPLINEEENFVFIIYKKQITYK